MRGGLGKNNFFILDRLFSEKMSGKDLRNLTGRGRRAPNFLDSLNVTSLGGRNSVSKKYTFEKRDKIIFDFFMKHFLCCFQPALYHPIAGQIKGMVEVDVLRPPVHSPSGIVAPFHGRALQSVVWHPQRNGVAAVCDSSGSVLIFDVFQGRSIPALHVS